MMFWRKKFTRRSEKKSSRLTLWLWRAVLFGFLLIALDAFYLAARLPNWEAYAQGPIKKSSFMERYEAERAKHKDWPALSWKPVPLSSVPKHLIRAVLVAEDSRFFSHNGIDPKAIQDALEYGFAKKRFVYGASTLSQQTVKNLFFSPSRNPLRKLHELVFTYSMEQHLKKRRILETYLNIAEFGRGIYGVEAAARHYFRKPVNAVSEEQAIELAATLPGPVKHNPASRTRFFLSHKRTIARHYGPLAPIFVAPAKPSDLEEPPVTAPVEVPAPSDEPDPIPHLAPDSIPDPVQDPIPIPALEPIEAPSEINPQ